MDETKDETTAPRLHCTVRHANAAWTISGDPKSTDSRRHLGDGITPAEVMEYLSQTYGPVFVSDLTKHLS
jgi:hypothetical protein